MKSLSSILGALLAIILCASCEKPNSGSQEDLSFLPSFEYQGYTYFIHNNIGKFTLADGTEKVKQLSSYGYTSWFIPSIDELMIALNHGLIDIYSDWKVYSTGYWSSSTVRENYNWLLKYAYEYDSVHETMSDEPKWSQQEAHVGLPGWILPMIRVRNK